MEKYSPDLRARLMDRETSIRTRISCPGGGTIVTMGFPGLAFDVRGDTYIDRERMTATLSDEALTGYTLLIVLVEREEVPEIAWPLLAEVANAQALDVVHMPIRDYEAPDEDFLAQWQAIAPQISATLDADGVIALSCHYGAGRSGTVAAAMLMDRGLATQAAIDHVRSKFADSIESQRQIEWLQKRGVGVKT